MASGYQPLTDSQWQVIQPLLKSGAHWRKNNLRSIFDAIRYKCRTGCQWCALPTQFPAYAAVAYYFYRWTRLGLWPKINEAANKRDRTRAGKGCYPSFLCVDSQSVLLAPRACEQRGLDAHKKINGRKQHIAVDTGGRIWAATVTAASCHDGPAGIALLAKIPLPDLLRIVGDKAYRGRFQKKVEELKIAFETGSRPPSDQGFVPIKKRWIVERTFA